MEQLNVTVYRTDTHIIITGIPDEGDTTHHCDAMGCGQEHVLYRFPLPVKIDIVKAVQAAKGYNLHYGLDGSVKIVEDKRTKGATDGHE